MLPGTGFRDLSEISRGGGGVETEGGSQLFETAEKGGVMKNGPLKYVSDHPQKKKEVLYFVKKNLGEIGEPSAQLSESELDS